MRKWQANIGLLTCAMLWGVGFIATDIALESMTPLVMQTFRFGIAAVLMSIIFHKQLRSISKETYIAGILTALVFILGMTLQSYGLVYTTISKSAFFTVTNVAWVPIMLFIFTRKKISYYIIIGILMMLIGFFFLIFQIDIFNLSSISSTLQSQANFTIGDVYTILCAIFFAMHIILTGIYSRKHSVVQLLTLQMWGATLFSFILVFVLDGGSFSFDRISLIACIIMAIFPSIIAFGLQIVCQKYADTSQAAILLTTEAAFATVFSVILGREHFFSGLVIGGTLILLGVIIAETELSFLNSTNTK